MGSSGGKLLRQPDKYVSLVENAVPGSCIYSCSLDKWVANIDLVPGFAESADYSTPRECPSRILLLRPSGLDGRIFRVRKLHRSMISIEDPKNHRLFWVEIPAFHTSGKMPLKFNQTQLGLNQWQPMEPDGIMMIGCRGNLAVVQVLHRGHCYVPEFYFIDLEIEKCIAKFHSKDVELMWHECYISPDRSRVILRPDITYSVMDSMEFHRMNDVQVVTMKTFGGSGGYYMTFDNRHGHRYLFRAKDHDVHLFDFQTMTITQSAKSLSLPAAIRQIKSSPSGDYLAVRCLYPPFSRKYLTNTIAVIDAATLSVLSIINSTGFFNQATETLSVQVFPVFSACESTVAVHRNLSPKPRVYIHKLPVVLHSLRHLCRQTLRRHFFVQDFMNPNVPAIIVKYLKYEF